MSNIDDVAEHSISPVWKALGVSKLCLELWGCAISRDVWRCSSWIEPAVATHAKMEPANTSDMRSSLKNLCHDTVVVPCVLRCLDLARATTPVKFAYARCVVDVEQLPDFGA